MDLTKDRSRLDFFLLRKAKTTPADGLDCAEFGSPSAGPMNRADTAPAASAAAGAGKCWGDAGGREMSSSDPAPDAAAADEAAAANEEALYWQQHGEVEEDEQMGLDSHEHSHAAGCGSLEDPWHSTAPKQSSEAGEALPASCPAAQPVAEARRMAPVKAEPEPSPSSLMSRDCREETNKPVLCTARVKREPLELFKSSAACGLEQGRNTLPSLQQFSYSKGQPSAGENCGTRQGSCGSRDRKVLVELGLDSPKARLPACMAAGSAAAAAFKLGSPAAACRGCQAAHVIDICSPENAAPKQAAPSTGICDSAHAVKGEATCSTTSCERGRMRSPADRESVDLAAVDLAEQKRILRMISMHKSLKEDLQASRLCMQALSSGAQSDQGLKRRNRAAAAEAATAPQPTGAIKRRQLGIGAFLLSQQRTDGA